ncbi:phosphoglycolate phosphatase [Enterovirga aerilata]|uniref:Phosphoglycolate phosphatase n=1 Tax=Enterovirga aerilata TaxID=2730920 RepID=A0A849I519_9HYPH|nr:phosphoglycolate phosphatase [Enterovirga sp. DB1703]NNM72468.1 phosphoglycolate phosphatase [Enterovirga sp. DB1703]
MPRPPIAVFDLDGTLADTAPDLIATLNAILAREGVPPVPLEAARDLIGAGARALVERGFEAAGLELAPAKSDALYRDFLAHYAENLCVESRLFPGVSDALERLAAEGFRLAVCTNKVELLSRRLLEGLGAAERFVAICGRDTFPYFKPDPRHLTLTIEQAGGDPARAVMVGDSQTDISTAKAAGIPVVGVTFGYTDTPVRELGPDAVIDRFEELPAAVAAIAAGWR